jgi:hypothetical protein
MGLKARRFRSGPQRRYRGPGRLDGFHEARIIRGIVLLSTLDSSDLAEPVKVASLPHRHRKKG